MTTLNDSVLEATLLHYGSFPFTSEVGSESKQSSRGIFGTSLNALLMYPESHFH